MKLLSSHARLLCATAFAASACILTGASAASAESLFTGNFETGDLTEWSHTQAIPGRITVGKSIVGQGVYAGRFEVKEGDKEPETGLQRAHVDSPLEYKESDVRYFRILSRVDSWDFTHWGMIWQVSDQSGGSPPLSLQLFLEKSTPILWLGSGDGVGEYWEAPLPGGLEKWFEVVIRVEFGKSGSLKVWLNGKSQTMLNKATTYEKVNTLGTGPAEDKLGINRSSSSTTTAVVYHDDYRVTNEFFSEPPTANPFTGNFETGNLTEWSHTQAIPGRITVGKGVVSQGTYAGRFEVKEGDKEPETGSQRAEVISGREFEESQVRYFRILSRIDSWDFTHWGMIWQIHDESSGSPPLSLQLYMSKSTPMLWLGSGDGVGEYWEAPLPGGMEKWFEVVIRVEFGKSGSLKVWLNGKSQTMLNKATTYEKVNTLGESPAYDKLGIYRSTSATSTAVVYHDDYRITNEFFSEPPK